MPLENEFHGPNLAYILELYERYRDDPNAVDEATRKLFEQWTPAEAAVSVTTTQDLLTSPGLLRLLTGPRTWPRRSASMDIFQQIWIHWKTRRPFQATRY